MEQRSKSKYKTLLNKTGVNLHDFGFVNRLDKTPKV